jgi:mRNA interferase RelE/StbE
MPNVYTVRFHKEVIKIDLRKVNPAIKDTLVNSIYERISKRPHDFKRLVGYKNVWRLRVADYRIVYKINDTSCSVDILAIEVRSKVYSKVASRQ